MWLLHKPITVAAAAVTAPAAAATFAAATTTTHPHCCPQVEDRPIMRERVETLVEHRPVQKEYVTEVR